MPNAFNVLLMLAISSAATGGTDALEPVNVVAESGLDIGPCAGGGTLSYPPPLYKGSAYFLRKADAGFATRHDALTKQRAPWLHRLDGPSGTNRLFTATDGGRALVFWTCQSGACDGNIAYGAYGLQSAEYAIRVYAPGELRSLGSTSSMLAAAIACAQAHDDRVRGKAFEDLKKQTGR